MGEEGRGQKESSNLQRRKKTAEAFVGGETLRKKNWGKRATHYF